MTHAATLRKPFILLTLLLALVLLTACASDSGGADGDPAQTVERYLQAKVEGNEDTIRSLLCSEMEAETARETHTFTSVTGVEIEDMTCTRNDGQDTVSCTGQIVAQYGGEDTVFPLTSYRVVQEDGEWKWCGEAG
ncbi:MAG: hypothetical protein K8L99_09785 [Anaerolineae bacterium]|nr:hypothetical protein [Anaerolineae bacterium]